MSATAPTSKLSRRSSRPPPAGTIVLDPMIELQRILATADLDMTPSGHVVLSSKAGSLADISLHKTRETALNDQCDTDEKSTTQSIEQMMQLHEEIAKSDQQFAQLQRLLGEFQSDLGSLSADMEQLQNRSVTLSRKLEKRTDAESMLGPVVEALVVPPSTVKTIVEQEITPAWRAALEQVSDRNKRVKEISSRYDGGSAVVQAQEQLQLLNYKAVERIRDFVVMRIRSLRLANVNAQSVQSLLLEYRDLFEFLGKENEALADDLQLAYANTMKWYYSSRFSRYIKALEKLPLYAFDKTVLLGDDSSAKRGLFSRAGPATAGVSAADMNIGSRANIITSEDPTVMLAQIAETSSTTHYLETGYRSLNLALVDNASVEFQFISDFFHVSNDKAATLFNEIFTPTFNLVHNYTKTLIQDTFDCYGILICIRLAKRFEFEAQHRKVAVMEDYLNLEMINLWPRFQSVMDSHCESLRRAATRSSSFAFAASGGSEAPSASVPHQLTQQFASLLSGILSLCPEDDAANEPVASSVTRLRSDLESFLTKISSVVTDPKNRERFLHHNYALVETVLSDIPGKLAEQQQEHFKLLTHAYSQQK